MKNAARNILIGVLLLAAVVGAGPLLNLFGCGPQTPGGQAGWLNNVTTQQVNDALKVGGDVGTVILTATGNPQWAVVLDLVVRVLSILAAWLIRPPAKPVAAVPGETPPDSTG